MVRTTDLASSQLLWIGDGLHTFDNMTWLPDKKDELLFVYIRSGIPSSLSSGYQVINVETAEHRELFTNGWGLELSLDTVNGDYQVVFYREFVNHQQDLSIWVATLSY